MPVTIKPASHGANAVVMDSKASYASDVADLFRQSCSQEAAKLAEIKIIQSSFEKLSADDLVLANSNGFVNAAIEAYSKHHNLIIRPEDVWFSILTQLNAYINANAEELRGLFVAHNGQKELVITQDSGNKGTAFMGFDYGKFSFQMSNLIAENIKDPSLREWILPTFTTTTKVDQAVASILMMSSMQKYFRYTATIMCGLPSVTLLGEKEDWQKIEQKLERLPTFGEQTAEWYKVLKPVISRFVKSFDEPDADTTKDFWQKIAHFRTAGSGASYWSGWITAFCFWGELGNPLYPRGRFGGNLKIDGACYHLVESNQVPRGMASVPVTVKDDYKSYDTVMVAGSVGIRVSSSGEMLHGKDETGYDTLQGESGWWMYEKT